MPQSLTTWKCYPWMTSNTCRTPLLHGRERKIDKARKQLPRLHTYFLEVDEEADIIVATILAVGGESLQSRDETSVEMELEIMCSKMKTVTVKEDTATWHTKTLAVSKLLYTQRSIKRS